MTKLTPSPMTHSNTTRVCYSNKTEKILTHNNKMKTETATSHPYTSHVTIPLTQVDVEQSQVTQEALAHQRYHSYDSTKHGKHRVWDHTP